MVKKVRGGRVLRGLEQIIGDSLAIRAVRDKIRRVAETEATVLITGESGTGKELVAEAIHVHSPRRDGPYSAVNMAAVPETLVESELFGHVRGAFTGATVDRRGRFEAADQGTLFIDEIGDLHLASQAKLLRVIEGRTVTPVGGTDPREVQVRLIAATNRSLELLVERGEFREDLYYRLNVVRIVLPPLRKRRDDIPLLIDHFLEEMTGTYGPVPQLSGSLRECLMRHPWPGNVRQLRNSLESMIVLADKPVLSVEDLPAALTDAKPNGEFEIPGDLTLDQIERAAILQALDRHDGNRTHAARSLAISVRTLQRKLRRWGMGPRDDSRGANGRHDENGNGRADEMEPVGVEAVDAAWEADDPERANETERAAAWVRSEEAVF